MKLDCKITKRHIKKNLTYNFQNNLKSSVIDEETKSDFSLYWKFGT